MKVRGKGLLGSMLAVVLVIGALLGACGTDQPTGVAVQTVSGVVTVGTPTVGLKACTSCHTSQTSDWMLTKHANVEPLGNLYSAGNPTLGQIVGCSQNCHDSTGDGAGNSFTANYTGNIARPVVGCESCHGGGQMHVDQGGAGPIGFATTTAMVIGTTSTLQASAQLRTCTGCHELLDPNDPLNTAATPTHLASTPTATGDAYIITDTHFATPGIFTGIQGANVLDVSGYAMDYASERVCIDCHNPHKPADINREWAQSKHADKTAALAWAHYNWSCDDGSNCGGLGLFGSRTTCQRCHTTTGYAAYANALGAGNTALADSIWNGSAPPLKPYNPNFKPEMLECAGCHLDNKGTVRNPGAYKASYKIPAGGFPPPFIMPTTADVAYQYPDITASNVCMPCHTGRMSGKAIQNLNTGQTATANFGNLAYNTVDGHYLTAGGTVFRGTAYEYGGRSYSNPSSYKHDDIGTPSAPNTGANGPCVGCHMDRPGLSANHLFTPVGKDGAGKIMSVSSEVCFTCHAGSATEFGLIVEEEKEVFEAAMIAFDEQLLVSGYTFTTTFPYFPYSNWLSPGDTDTTGNMTGKNNLGAAFNFSLLHHEPGAFVHNSRYVKRLMYDSIDWLDDNTMNYTVGLTMQTMSTFPSPTYKEGAMRYLLNQASYDSGGNVIPGIPAERP
jgi:hypothetical protein